MAGIPGGDIPKGVSVSLYQESDSRWGIYFQNPCYRHTLATRFYDDGVSIQTIRDYLGHFSEEMTKQYVDFMPKRIAKASDAYFKKPGNDLASAITVKKRGDKK